jgi:hypothetical protein
MGTRSATSTHRRPYQRLMQRRCQQDRRSTLRWDPDARERRHGTGRRKEDNRDAMKAALPKSL